MTPPPGEFISSRRIGDAAVTVISEGTLRWAPRFQVPEEQWRRALPDADPDGRITLGLNLMLVQAGGVSIVIDPGCDDPQSGWRRAFEAKWPGSTRTAGLAAAMVHVGVSPEQITHVAITHAHEDHFAGVMLERDGHLSIRFPRARHLLHRADWHGNPRLQEADSPMAIRLGAVQRAGLLDLIEGEHELAPGVTMIPAPGESPGHCVLRLRSGDAAAYFLGDLFHHACEIAHPDWVPGQNRGPVTLLETRTRLLPEIAASQAAVVFAHARFPGWGRVMSVGDSFDWVRE
jgi:glyoxylase-like metal-dependent hydrolase (beta-lactamase superfamily II)